MSGLWPILGIALWCLIYGLRWYDKKQMRAAISDNQAVKIGDVLAAGWSVELDGEPIAALSSPTREMDAPYWMTYVIEPLTEDPALKAQLFDLAFWQSGKLAYRSRKLGVLAEGVIVGDVPVCPRTRRITVRGFTVAAQSGSARGSRLWRSIAADTIDET
jgi:hypothetical protein